MSQAPRTYVFPLNCLCLNCLCLCLSLSIDVRYIISSEAFLEGWLDAGSCVDADGDLQANNGGREDANISFPYTYT